MSIKFFKAEMNRAIEKGITTCLAKAELDDGYKDMAASFKLIPETGYEDFEFGAVLPGWAVAEALLAMKMSDWEKFYCGMAEWKASAPKYPVPGRAEEDARGVMLMALADRCRELEKRQ